MISYPYEKLFFSLFGRVEDCVRDCFIYAVFERRCRHCRCKLERCGRRIFRRSEKLGFGLRDDCRYEYVPLRVRQQECADSPDFFAGASLFCEGAAGFFCAVGCGAGAGASAGAGELLGAAGSAGFFAASDDAERFAGAPNSLKRFSACGAPEVPEFRCSCSVI